MDKVITIPYAPRFPQNLIHPQLENHRFNVLVAHRRLGKTVLAVNHLIKLAATCKSNDGRFAYIAPFLKQAKLIAWDYIKKFTAPIPGMVIREGDLIAEFPNGSRIYLFGADNPDALRGTFLDFCCLDEYAQIKNEVFSEIIRPALSDRNGGCLFMGTPKGQNQFFDIYNHAVQKMQEGDKSWWAGIYRGDETGVISEAEMAELRSVMAESTYRQEILCDFTAASDNVLITIDMVSNSCARSYSCSDLIYEPTVVGVDVARFGDDSSVFQVRHGKQADEPMIFKGVDNMTLVGHLSHLCDRIKPEAVFIDAGRGEGIIDRMRQLGYSVQEINFGGSPVNPHYVNKRMEMWDLMKEWIVSVGQLPNVAELKSDLVTPTYSFDAMNRMKLESKEDVKKRLGRSTDVSDALALTFAMPVRSRLDVINRTSMPKVALR
jgi:hypothetical protein